MKPPFAILFVSALFLLGCAQPEEAAPQEEEENGVQPFSGINDVIPSGPDIGLLLLECGKKANIQAKDDCIESLALEFREKTLCEKLENPLPGKTVQDKRNACREKINKADAIDSLDSSKCFSLENHANREECISVVASKTLQPELCGQLKTVSGKIYCYTGVALAAGDRKICEQLSAQTNVETCIQKLAVKALDPAACNYFGGLSKRNNCIRAVAIEASAPELCDFILDEFDKKSCRNAVQQ